MIRGYSDHAANERTFLAWVRTGIAVIAFGFVIEKFNLFVLTIASSASAEAAHRLQLERLSGPLGRYGGVALITGGLALIVAQPRASSVPGDCLMTRRCTPPAAYAPS
jgi:putative membrane protein